MFISDSLDGIWIRFSVIYQKNPSESGSFSLMIRFQENYIAFGDDALDETFIAVPCLSFQKMIFNSLFFARLTTTHITVSDCRGFTREPLSSSHRSVHKFKIQMFLKANRMQLWESWYWERWGCIIWGSSIAILKMLNSCSLFSQSQWYDTLKIFAGKISNESEIFFYLFWRKCNWPTTICAMYRVSEKSMIW